MGVPHRAEVEDIQSEPSDEVTAEELDAADEAFGYSDDAPAVIEDEEYDDAPDHAADEREYEDEVAEEVGDDRPVVQATPIGEASHALRNE